ncbi:LOW QUALITY PROTEIN: tripartite motif-containing protein 15-like [Meles meles]|uniref:LOW QUALITY PROTEIN: tripartite motif-containing protein 15-like n=1 Tax=Meles meles TaxID=9662 RepID=UPI001E69E875|nr:LOW QUALITY PROTEIN: tripartite motif-containing protein 15-like [Meles meles]
MGGGGSAWTMEGGSAGAHRSGLQGNLGGCSDLHPWTHLPGRAPPPSRMGARPSCQALLCVPRKEKEPIQPLVVPVPLGPLGETCCEEHGEKIYFFCEADAELLCVVCRESPSHCSHPAAILAGAVQPHRDRLRSQSKALHLEKSEMEATWRREDRKLQELLTHIESKKQQVDAVFRRLQQELADQHCLLQARLRELEQQTCIERDQYNSKFSEEINRLGAQAQELEEHSQRPASVLLQDIRADHSRYEKRTFVSPETISPDLVKKIRDLHRKTLSLPEMLRTFSENLAHHLETESGLVPPDPDPRALSRSLALPEDRKPATFTRDRQDLTDSARRSEDVPGVPGTPGCPSGRHRRQVPPGAPGEAGAGPERRPAVAPLPPPARPCPAAPRSRGHPAFAARSPAHPRWPSGKPVPVCRGGGRRRPRGAAAETASGWAHGQSRGARALSEREPNTTALKTAGASEIITTGRAKLSRARSNWWSGLLGSVPPLLETPQARGLLLRPRDAHVPSFLTSGHVSFL